MTFLAKVFNQDKDSDVCSCLVIFLTLLKDECLGQCQWSINGNDQIAEGEQELKLMKEDGSASVGTLSYSMSIKIEEEPKEQKPDEHKVEEQKPEPEEAKPATNVEESTTEQPANAPETSDAAQVSTPEMSANGSKAPDAINPRTSTKGLEAPSTEPNGSASPSPTRELSRTLSSGSPVRGRVSIIASQFNPGYSSTLNSIRS